MSNQIDRQQQYEDLLFEENLRHFVSDRRRQIIKKIIFFLFAALIVALYYFIRINDWSYLLGVAPVVAAPWSEKLLKDAKHNHKTLAINKIKEVRNELRVKFERPKNYDELHFAIDGYGHVVLAIAKLTNDKVDEARDQINEAMEVFRNYDIKLDHSLMDALSLMKGL